MESSDLKGRELLETLTNSTGLPQEGLQREVSELLAKASLCPENLNLDDLRQVLADYLQEILLSSKENY